MLFAADRRVAQLEEKLDSLVSMLKTTQQLTEDHGSTGSTAFGSLTIRQQQQPLTPQSQSSPPMDPALSTLEHVPQFRAPDYRCLPNCDRPRHDADVLLTIYIREMAPQFPFVVVPEGTSARELGQSKPFLLKVILMVAFFHSVPGQSVMVKELMEYLSEHMILGAEKTFDMLQGLLVLFAW